MSALRHVGAASRTRELPRGTFHERTREFTDASRAPAADAFSVSYSSPSSPCSGSAVETKPDVRAIVAEQAALRRVALLAARGVCTERLFAAVNQELARLVGADAAALLRFEPEETITLLAA